MGVTIRQRGRNNQVRVSSRCTTMEACADNAQQNFVGSLKLLHQCRPTDKLSRRFPQTKCTACAKMQAADGTNQIFPSGSSSFVAAVTSSTFADMLTATNLETYFTVDTTN